MGIDGQQMPNGDVSQQFHRGILDQVTVGGNLEPFGVGYLLR